MKKLTISAGLIAAALASAPLSADSDHGQGQRGKNAAAGGCAMNAGERGAEHGAQREAHMKEMQVRMAQMHGGSGAEFGIRAHRSENR